jgi:hypothetical protein
MKGFLGPALTSRDRNLIKTFLSNLTSGTFMGSGVLDVKFDDKSIKQAKLETNCAIDEIYRKSLQFSRYNLNKQKATCSQRLPGSGRKRYAELYPELAACMLELFDKGSESGLSAHPRLIHYSWKKTHGLICRVVFPYSTNILAFQ